MKITAIRDWGLGIKAQNRPIIISGPCSAETEEQVLQTCLAIAQQGVDVLRAGIWKPRTRPNSFEGVGTVGLSWIKLAGRTTGLPVCIEIANGRHVEQALKHGIDILWIGARTSANPFAVQEIADALRGVDVPVMVKNPVNPDLELWIGALERIYHAGIHKLAAVHRGFSVYNAKPFRNQPQWEIPIELRRRIRGLEVICDPSHICGRRDLLLGVAQHALDLDFDGLMLESHINPKEAWSDALQQVRPQQLAVLLGAIVQRKASSNNPIYKQKLNGFRQRIDELDLKVLDILARRMEVVRDIGLFKKENNVAILQLERWAKIYQTRIEQASKLAISKDFVEELIEIIHKESIRQQTEIMQQQSIENRAVKNNGK